MESDEHQNTSDIKLSIINVPSAKTNINVNDLSGQGNQANQAKSTNNLNINIQPGHFSESTSSDSEYESSSCDESSNERLVDAETSDN